MESLSFLFESDRPLYRQLYEHLAGAILCGELAPGEKLPAKRRLAADLQVSVNTVDAAYQMLTAEGYLTARPRSGFRVCRLEKPLAAAPEFARPLPDEEKGERTPLRYDLGTANVDPELFPFKTWRRIQRDVLAGSPDLLSRGHSQGDADLRAAVARHLRETRGVQCRPEQLVVGAGMEYLLGLLARLFPEKIFALEDPGYPQTAAVLENSGAGTLYLPVDGMGLSGERLAGSPATLACVTPSHQFPTGATMPLARRAELLNWAREGEERWILEDDYDSDFRYSGRPLPSLQGLDGGQRVITIGTFSRSISPAIRIAYMVLPETLLPRYRKAYGGYACTVSRFEQQTLCRFVQEGHYARHLARCRTAYRKRRDLLLDALRDVLGKENIRVTGDHTGLHFLLHLSGSKCPEEELVFSAAQSGVALGGLSSYTKTPRQSQGGPALVLGYGALRPEDIPGAANALKEAWKEALT